MFPAALIIFRETIEIVLVIGIIFSYLTKSGQNFYKKYIWYGTAFGIILSTILSFIIKFTMGNLHGFTGQLFEGLTMFVTAGFITWMIMWVHKQKDVSKKIKHELTQHIESGYKWGIVTLAALSVLREGSEAVLYLNANSITGGTDQLTGVIIGIAAAVFLGFIIFRLSLRINLTLIFRTTSIFLILFAAGLITNGIHEFQEIRLLPVFSFDPVLNISHIIDQNSIPGSFLETLFGYTSKPTILELISYSAYIIFILMLQKTTSSLIEP